MSANDAKLSVLKVIRYDDSVKEKKSKDHDLDGLRVTVVQEAASAILAKDDSPANKDILIKLISFDDSLKEKEVVKQGNLAGLNVLGVAEASPAMRQ